ncbi:MAG: MiaB/RimO family radical SAM methylthiotransferase, partial [Actinomycetes bacterium]
VADGVNEITLLGQNVNAYGVELGVRGAFADLLRACGEVEGLERVRFTSPHPRDFTDDVIAAMAETHNVMPHLHMPLQSGSDAILKSMRRSYRADRYLGIVERVREALPLASITTDIIVGFPGESEADFQKTLDLIATARFEMAFTFKYSKRPGTAAAEMDNQIPEDVVAERYVRLHAFTEEIAWQQKKAQVGREVEVLVSDMPGRKDDATLRQSGRARDFNLVHFVSEERLRPGDIATVKVTQAAPHHLVADNPPLTVRRTRSGDVWESAQASTETRTFLSLTPRP